MSPAVDQDSIGDKSRNPCDLYLGRNSDPPITQCDFTAIILLCGAFLICAHKARFKQFSERILATPTFHDLCTVTT